MIKSEVKRRIGKQFSSIVFVFLIFFLCASSALSIGYAPLTFHGHVHVDGEVVVGAEVSLQVLENQSFSFSKKTFTNENGDFIFVVSLEENSPIDVQISTRTTEIYVDIIEDALPWNTYSLDMNLDLDDFAKVKVISSKKREVEFDDDMEKIISGEILDNASLIQEFEEKYDMEVVPLDKIREAVIDENEESSQAVLESPSAQEKYLPAPKAQKTKGFTHTFFEILAFMVVVVCIFLVRYEAKHNK